MQLDSVIRLTNGNSVVAVVTIVNSKQAIAVTADGERYRLNKRDEYEHAGLRYCSGFVRIA